MMQVTRNPQNPILSPNVHAYWEAEAAFNGCPIMVGDTEYMLYRAVSWPHYYFAANQTMQLSSVGIARREGELYVDRRRFIKPEFEWERFGCEDPRIVHFEGKYYTFYTALGNYPFSAAGIKVAVAVGDSLDGPQEKHLVTPFNAKAMTLFPERINGKIYGILAVNTDLPPARVCLVSFDNIEDLWNQEKWKEWYRELDSKTLHLTRNEKDHVEVGASPVKTEYGWLFVYSYIRNYFTGKPILWIEAIVLDEKDPTRIIARTDYPLLTPEESYEKYGMVPNIVFPSWVKIEGNNATIYYGGADTVTCTATVNLDGLFKIMCIDECIDHKLHRHPSNPIMKPIKDHSWEARAVFNPSALDIDGESIIIYRTMSMDNTSAMGYARSRDGFTIDERLPYPIYSPREDFEAKKVPGWNSGCEDPRLTILEDKVYMCYTAYDGIHAPRIALTWITLENFKNKYWEWSKPVLISPPHFDNKDACVFPAKVDGQYMVIHRVGYDIDFDLVNTLDFDGNTWLNENRWITVRPGMWDDLKVGLAGTPVLIDEWWLMLYHGVSSADHTYRSGALLLDKKDPRIVLGRSYYPLIEPKEDYEMFGQVNNVVFPEGYVVRGRELIVYYGGGDQVVWAASMHIDSLLASLV
jgi:beta-1,2-mannobiose phosphorylase / 1,2-beta-oligomannan phosphorylase